MNDFEINFEWGEKGMLAYRDQSDIMIVVDVLSFSTCVSICVNRGATVYPYLWKDERANDFAKKKGAILAGKRGKAQYSLSPVSLKDIPLNSNIVLPSPNGSTISLLGKNRKTIAGCIRNAEACARYAAKAGQKITLIAAGERWEDNSLRPSLEDQLGCGMIISYLTGNKSPEALAAENVYLSLKEHLEERLQDCLSGKELIDRGYEVDVDFAVQANVDEVIPVLIDGVYVGVGQKKKPKTNSKKS